MENCSEKSVEKGPLKFYNLVMDNCGGQNKNTMVIFFFLMLCEIGIIGEVNIIFLIRRHTKNLCDQIFALLKKYYHYKNLYT